MRGAFQAVWARYLRSELGAAFLRLSNLGWKIFDKSFSAPTPTVELDPETTLVAIIDPQRGFSAPSGTFGRVFGAEELGPLREALKELALFLNSLPKEVGVVLVLSEYPKGLHTAGTTVEPLSNLCVAGDRDCDLADGLAIKDSWVVAIKHRTDAWTSPEFRAAIWRLIERGGKHLVVTGLTATTCVRESILSILSAIGQATITVLLIRDLIGSRASSYSSVEGEPSRVDQAYSVMATSGALVVPTWRCLRWRRCPIER
jgi:nicotinamidase-related amidase